MTNKELTRVTDSIRGLVRMARNPAVTRKGNLIITALVKEFTEKPKAAPKKTSVDTVE